MYEVELKAKLNSYEFTRAELLKQNPVSTYRVDYYDRYYDLNNALNSTEKELRLRTKVTIDTSKPTHFLTFKESPFDVESKSKPEFETEVIDPKATETILSQLGYTQTISYTKHCEIFKFIYEGLQVEVALVKLDKLKDTFLEIETLTPYQENTDTLFKILYDFLKGIKIKKDQLTTSYYVDLIKETDNTA